MKLRTLHRALLASAVVLAFGTAPAMAAPTPEPFGACVGSATKDCTTTTAHASVSVVKTLSINEERALSFGNIAVGSHGAGDANIKMDTSGNLTLSGANTDGVVLLHGHNANDGTGTIAGAAGNHPGAAGSDAQSPGHYTVSGGNEGTTTQVYISVATSGGAVVDMCTPGNVCDNYHSGNKVTITNGTDNFFVDQFVINESGSDVYGHYIDNSGAAVGTGTTTPFNPSGHTAFGAGTAGVVDVVLGATLHTDAAATAYAAGKYSGGFNVMVSY